ncbi:MAG TPA: tRNA (adenosine(37)-N6)-threonylcarbamoyltransferase complex ATPase subunit type 1 TsaE [Exiguobacterium sp.]|uniref:tRNA (adenosine(37)-N6)-threonylcarbamoyltransferase complex ATPase subunit type 1 TsaE n=1 Tax=Exiguobacterium sp. TaxID=44751 RepID=UPI000EEEDF0C|nr:tRNA (adenosine(37)-N6)-threonylcarbamoyltransferase complex ATPase subunit type 1 TsaE [Exiguobacterium sp.]HCN57907.1 tRNA (adenosine(37)-N6)-threonylcarbamoyltransferase complex ATPase subunit type 1 TsaE [Exiguobacterium sp.]
MMELEMTSLEQTTTLAVTLGHRAFEGMVITLDGDLGAGKTTFTQGFAKGLGVTRNVNSPTFTIMKVYAGRLPLYHMDVYRLEGGDDIGLEEYLNGDGVAVVEWSELIADVLPPERLAITIERTGDDSRRFRLEPIGEQYIQLCEGLNQ